MDNVVIEALRESIKHWERLSTGKRRPSENVGRCDCSLCSLFNREDIPYQFKCLDCPVYQHTGQMFCEGTPFIRAQEIAEDCEKDEPLDTAEFKEAAAEELEFLKSLLPKIGQK